MRHRNESTLTHYITSASEMQKQQASNILTTSLIGETSNVENSSEIVSKDINAVDSVREMEIESSNLFQHIMSNATFQNCSITFYGQASKM